MVEVPEERLDEVIGVLAGAFRDYEAMQYMLGEPGPDYWARLRTLVGLFAGSRVAVGTPILGAAGPQKPELVAAALVDPPFQPPRSVVADVTRLLGPHVARRLRRFGAALAPLEPEFGFYYLGMIGVTDGYRGKGYARQIIEGVTEASFSDNKSRGVLLTTEHQPNISFYNSAGFEVLGEATTADGGLRSWTMFRPTT